MGACFGETFLVSVKRFLVSIKIFQIFVVRSLVFIKRFLSMKRFLVSIKNRAPSQYPKRALFVRSRKVSKPRDWYFKLSYRFEIWQAHRQHCCRSACEISEGSDNSKYKSRGFETLRDLTKRGLFGYWDGAQVPGVYTEVPGLYHKEVFGLYKEVPGLYKEVLWNMEVQSI